MKLLWTLVKVVLALALVIPVSIIALSIALGIFGALVGVAFLALRIAILGLVLWGGFRLVGFLLRGRSAQPVSQQARELPAVDPHYAAAMRELDRELGAH